MKEGEVSRARNSPVEVIWDRFCMVLKAVKILDFLIRPVVSSYRNLSREVKRSNELFKDSLGRQYR